MTKNGRPISIMLSGEDTTDTSFSDLFSDKEPGYNEWLLTRVNRTMDRVASGDTTLREHASALLLLKDRLDARLHRIT